MRKFILLLLLLSCVTLNASNTKKVIFNIEGELLEFEVEEGKTVGSIKKPVKEGYNFLGWFSDGLLYDFNKPVTEDLEIVAIFSLKNSEIYVKEENYKYFIVGLHIIAIGSLSLPTLYYFKKNII